MNTKVEKFKLVNSPYSNYNYGRSLIDDKTDGIIIYYFEKAYFYELNVNYARHFCNEFDFHYDLNLNEEKNPIRYRLRIRIVFN